MPVPAWLDWDLWLGPNPMRPFHPDWMNRHSWREFGTSQLGNWATHSANLPFKALQIDSLWHAGAAEAAKIRLEAEVSSIERVNFPKWAAVRYDVPARGDLPPVKLTWHQGTGSPGFQDLIARIVKHGLTEDPRQKGPEKFTHHAGCLLVGSEGMLYAIAHNTSITLLPQEKFKDLQGPPRTLPRSRGHEREWFDACRGGPPAMSNFDYSGPLTEFLMLGNIATQFDRPIEFDPMAGRITNSPEADRLVLREYREGWTL